MTARGSDQAGRADQPGRSVQPGRVDRTGLAELFALDLRSLALFRILAGALVIFDLVLRAQALEAHYTDAGVLPRRLLISMFPPDAFHWSLHLAAGQTLQVSLLFVLHAVFALMLLVGWRTRFATVGTWLLLASLHGRNPLVVNGGDTLFRILLLWGAFLPLGARWSLDRLLDPNAKGDDADASNTYRHAPGVAFTLQLMFVYWFTFALKTGSEWWDGTAMHYTLHADQIVSRWGIALRGWPATHAPLTYFTMAWEVIGPALLIMPVRRGPLRTLAVAGSVAFHVGIHLFLEIAIFPHVCILAWLAMLPGWFWDGPFGRLRPRLAPFRDRIAQLAARVTQGMSPVSTRLVPSRVTAVFCSALIVYVFAWNVRTLDPKKLNGVMPKPARTLGILLRVSQRWGMFAPRPPIRDGWVMVLGRTKDQRVVDLLEPDRPPGWEKPEVVVDRTPNSRWRKYVAGMALEKYAAHRRYYARYLVRTWDRTHPPAEELVALWMYFIREDTRPDGPSPPRRMKVFARRYKNGVRTGTVAADAPPPM